MSVLAICASHTPLKDYLEPAPGVRAEVDACFAQLRETVAEFRPDLVLVFGPDHFNGFFHRLMPSFCLGAEAHSVGDWNTPAGALPCDVALAEAAVRHAHREGVDLALSHRMEIDHGLTQTLQMLLPWEAMPPVLPVFINCVGVPRPPLPRVLALGRALGGFIGTLGKRVLILGSGGLSHDPPVPSLAGAPPEVRERLIVGGMLTPEARAARQQRVVDDARKQLEGTSSGTPLNPAWDAAFLSSLERQDFDAMTAFDDDAITRDGGRGGHEIRAWVAVAGAMAALEAAPPSVVYYRAIPAWVAGFGVLVQRGR